MPSDCVAVHCTRVGHTGWWGLNDLDWLDARAERKEITEWCAMAGAGVGNASCSALSEKSVHTACGRHGHRPKVDRRGNGAKDDRFDESA